jgi:predicted Zn-ribbon and HTH transcriptional regulator
MLISKSLIKVIKNLIEKEKEKVLNRIIKEKDKNKKQNLFNELVKYNRILESIEKAP